MKAEIRRIGGVPTLFINDVKQVPMLLFTNTETGRDRREICAKQIRMARDKGMHLHSVCCHLPIYQARGQRNLAPAIEAMDTVIREDDQASILLRINISLYGPEAAEWEKTHPGETVRYALNTDTFGRVKMPDGTYQEVSGPAVSIASDAWLEAAIDTLDELTVYFKEHREYYDHLLGYHICAEDAGEWFHTGSRENGVDISDVNRRAWQRWLDKKYGFRVEGTLNAWNLNPKIHLEYSEIDVPYDIPANDRSWPVTQTLLTRPTDKRFIDYSDYCSELTVDRIKRLCRATREMTNGEKLNVVFYGYYYELYDARTGHFRLMDILDCPDVDALASPISYLDRNEGGTGAVMAPVDSIALHGKMWFVENDMRTGQVLRSHTSNDHTDCWLSRAFESVESLVEAYRREWTQMIAHNMGCWYMDLFARGWISHPEQWNCISSLFERYAELQDQAKLLEPEVAVIVDEQAMSVVAHAEECGARLMYSLRQNFYRAGVKLGWYTIEDFEEGRIPGNRLKVAWILTPFRMDRMREEKLQRAARKTGAAMVFVHGFGITPVDVVQRLTGMEFGVIHQSVENLAMDATPLMKDSRLFMPDADYMKENCICPFNWNENQLASPSYYVEPSEGIKVLATYTKGRLNGRIGAAMCDMDGYKSIFIGAFALTTDGIREVCRLGGAHIYSESNDALFIGERILAVHSTATPGVREIKLPETLSVRDENGTVTQTDTLNLWMDKTQTAFWVADNQAF